jgi:hypothetical protein
MTEKAKLPPWLRIAFGVAGAAAVAIGLRTMFQSGPPTADAIDQELSKTRIGVVMKERFSADYQNVLAQLVVLANDKSLNDDQRQQAAAEKTAAIRLKYADSVIAAPGASLSAALRAQANLLKAVETQNGATVCDRFANFGPGEIKAGMRDLAEPVDVAAEATMLAIADGRDKPVVRAEPSEDDMNLLFSALESGGMTEAQFEAIGNGTPDDGDCKYLGVMLESAIALPEEGGDRVRASLMQSIVATP